MLDVNSGPLESFGFDSDVVVISKSCTNVPEFGKYLDQMKHEGIKMYFDLIDGHPSIIQNLENFFSGFICSSKTEYNF